MSWTTSQIAERIDGQIDGPADLPIVGMTDMANATEGRITFIRDEKHAERWPSCGASAAIVPRNLKLEPGEGKSLIRVTIADLAVAQTLELFAPPPPRPAPGVHHTAVIDASATVGQNVAIGPYVVIGGNSTIGDGTVIHANVSISEEVTIGSECTIWSGTVIRERCSLGDKCVIHPNVTIGSDGFGYRPSPDGSSIIKIPQIGRVEIGNRVEIGSGTCIDRGTFGPTTIGDDTKIDNLCQIAHNCKIGRCVIIAGQTGIAGSVTIGDGAMFGGGVGVKDHLTIGAGAKLGGRSALMNDVPPGENWGGYPAKPGKIARREVAAVAKLPDLIKKLREYEQRAAQ